MASTTTASTVNQLGLAEEKLARIATLVANAPAYDLAPKLKDELRSVLRLGWRDDDPGFYIIDKARHLRQRKILIGIQSALEIIGWLMMGVKWKRRRDLRQRLRMATSAAGPLSTAVSAIASGDLARACHLVPELQDAELDFADDHLQEAKEVLDAREADHE